MVEFRFDSAGTKVRFFHDVPSINRFILTWIYSMNLTQQLIALAEEVEISDPIDWGMLEINERDAYELLAPSILEQYLVTDADCRDMMLLAVTLKLTVENFVLNMKLQKLL